MTEKTDQDETTKYSIILYDYAKYLHSKKEERYAQLLKRATDLISFTSLTSALLIFFFKDGQQILKSAPPQFKILFIAAVSMFLLSITMSIIVLRLKKTGSIPGINFVMEKFAEEKVDNETKFRNLISSFLSKVSSDIDAVMAIDAKFLRASHAFLGCGFLFLTIWAIGLIVWIK